MKERPKLPLTLRALAFMSAASFCFACGGGGGGSSPGAATVELSAEDSSDPVPRVSSLCGLYESGGVVAVPSREMEVVSVQILSSDAAIITRESGELAGQDQLVKFHGITSEGVASLRVLNGIDILQRELAQGALFFSAGDGCEVVFPGGGAGILGQLYSMSGESMSERMLAEAAAVPFADSICGGGALSQCYETIGILPRQPTPIELDVQDVSIPSRCGAVQSGVLHNPVLSAEIVRVEPISTDSVVVTRLLGVEAGNSQLVKLHGLTSAEVSPSRLELGHNFIINASSGGAYLVTESQECMVEMAGGGLGVVGQLYSMDGASINEELIANGYAFVSGDACGGDLLLACYQSLEAEAPPEPPPPPPAPEHPDSEEEEGNYVEGVIRDFLWKPVSESNGNVAVLVNPRNVRVVVSGAIRETLRNQGPSNGRGTTARGSAPGCAYGSNIVLEFLDSNGQPIPIISGGTTITIANGCNRVEFRR